MKQTKVVYSRCILWMYSSFSVGLVDTAYCAGFVSTNWGKLAWREARSTNLASQWKALRIDRTECELWKCYSVLKRLSLYSDGNLFRDAVKRKMLCSEWTWMTCRPHISPQKVTKKDRHCSNLKWCAYSVIAHQSFLFIPEVFILFLFSQTNLSRKAAITSSKANWKPGKKENFCWPDLEWHR